MRTDKRIVILAGHNGSGKTLLAVNLALSLRAAVPGPVIAADMALGEGTGAVALMPLLDMALAVYGGTHTFDALGMAAYTPQEGSV